jgi:hypothetical protein
MSSGDTAGDCAAAAASVNTQQALVSFDLTFATTKIISLSHAFYFKASPTP